MTTISSERTLTRTDLFISYRRKDSEHVLPLVDALREEGISPWLDQSEIDEFGPITDAIRKGLSESKALLAWYSRKYPKSRPCQMELAAAFLASQHDGDPRRRVLVIPKEDRYTLSRSSYGMHSMLVRRRRAPDIGRSPSGSSHTLQHSLGRWERFSRLPPPTQYGLKLVGASRFVGRLPELWRIHSALHGGESAITRGTSATALALLSGMGGIGKSLVATFQSERHFLMKSSDSASTVSGRQVMERGTSASWV